MPDSPAFGQADLTNCERELIHLAGSAQPHGVVIVLREADLVVVQVTDNARTVLGRPAEHWLGRPLAAMGQALADAVTAMHTAHDLSQARPLQADSLAGAIEGLLHRAAPGLLVLELEPLAARPGVPVAVTLPQDTLRQALSEAVRRLGDAPNLTALSDAAARAVRELTGYDRVMVYRFDPDGHGQVIAEALDARLEPLLGHRYPASDIPQRARSLYIRQRVRLLVDVGYRPSPLLPQRTPAGEELDMSLCGLRSMSPLHIQYLKNMGVTATLVVSLVVGGRLWGLIAAHHHSPRNLRFALRAACALIAEVSTTRLAAIENYAHAQVALLARRLQQRLVEATSTEGDWRLALFRQPQALLQPLEANGAVLFHDGELMSTGDVPSTPELRALRDWIDAQAGDARAGPFACSALAQAAPALAALAPLASGVLAVRLATDRPDWLIWLRREQLHSITWAGDPTKPMVGDDPLELSPRRSFAAWSEQVRGTAQPWSTADLALARAVGSALVDIIVQVNGVRLLIAEQQLLRTRTIMQGAQEPVLVCDDTGRPIFANPAFEQLAGCALADLPDWQAVCALFSTPEAVAAIRSSGLRWEGALSLRDRSGGTIPVQLRAETVPTRDGRPLGLMLTLDDRREAERTESARAALEQTLQDSARRSAESGNDPLMQAVLTHARLAAMDITDATDAVPMAPMLDELADSTRRAAAMLDWIRRF
jgi:light-regulated signal transduction histidine kinase (bacteriophytochrome)